MDGQSSIGERIRQLRQERAPRMTQRELAERAGVSVDTVSKLEQGVKQTALIGTLHKLAQALDVDVSALLARPARLDTEDGATAGVLAVRRALTSVDDLMGLEPEDEPEAPGALGDVLRRGWELYWTASYGLLSSLVPPLLAQARATARDDGTEAHELLAEVYALAASMMTLLGHVDLAYIGMDKALRAAERGDDALRRSALVGTLAWVLQHQGRWADAQRVAAAEAERIEPRLGTATPHHLSVWGTLLLTAATSTARDGKADAADDLVSVAAAVAARLGEDREDYQSTFGPSQTGMQSVDVAVVTDRPGVALTRAQRMPPEGSLPLAARARHLADVAAAQTALGRDAQAVDTLLAIERRAPEWMRYHGYPRTIVRELLERERRARTPRLRGLAIRLGVVDAAS